MASFIVRDDLRVVHFLVMEKIKHFCGILIRLKDYDRLFLCLLVINRHDLVLADDVIDLKNDVLIDLPCHVAEHYHLCGSRVFDNTLAAKRWV